MLNFTICVSQRVNILILTLFLLAVCSLSVCVAAEDSSDEREWLQNPGFEEASGGIPRSWHKFLSSALPEGSVAEWVDSTEQAYSRSGCIKIYLPENPIVETYTNWSQNILNVPVKHNYQLQGYIKTKEAEGVELWLQCFDSERHLLVNSASKTLYGTNDWSLVSTSITVPDATTILTVRCVLLGKGTAWFDDLSLKEAGAAPADDPVKKPVETADTNDGKTETGSSEKTLLETNRALLESNKLLIEQLDQLRGSLEQLKQEKDEIIGELRNENDSLKKQNGELRKVSTLLQGRPLQQEPQPATRAQPFLAPR